MPKFASEALGFRRQKLASEAQIGFRRPKIGFRGQICFRRPKIGFRRPEFWASAASEANFGTVANFGPSEANFGLLRLLKPILAF